MSFVNVFPKASCSIPGDRHVVITCEHAANQVPDEYRYLFDGAVDVLNSHRGYDIGALSLAKLLAEELDAALFHTTHTRLLIDPNRSRSSRSLFSTYTLHLDNAEKRGIIARYYTPFRKSFQAHIANDIRKNVKIVHFSIHTFTPILNHVVRTCDVGLLYDPSRKPEKDMALNLIKDLKTRFPHLRFRRNYPYRGTADGLATDMRKQFSASDYMGLEIEINQKFPMDMKKMWAHLQQQIGNALKASLR